MNLTGWEQLLFVCAATAILAPLLGRYLAATFRDSAGTRAGTKAGTGAGTKAPGDRIFAPVERLVYRALRVDPESSMTWQVYAIAVLVFGLIGIAVGAQLLGPEYRVVDLKKMAFGTLAYSIFSAFLATAMAIRTPIAWFRICCTNTMWM